ncbi:MAG: hypothetical protein ACP5XB_23705 [Isosphaeraceae bacterium]
MAAGLLINNEYVRRHRTIHVVNACGLPIQVKVDDGPPTSLDGQGQLTVTEGRHRVQFSGPVQDSVDLDMKTGYFDRWFKKPAWILNPGGEAVLDEITLYYAAQPRPSQHRVIAGQSLVVRPHVDYLFDTPPDSIEISNRNSEVVKSAFRWIQGQDRNAFLNLLDTDRNAGLTFAEGRSRHYPADYQLLRDYAEQAQSPGQDADSSRIETFLKSGLNRKPVPVEWHRAYQSVCQDHARDQGLVALYDQFLSADPRSALLLYLRGRIDPDWKRRETWYHKSIDADPGLAWPWEESPKNCARPDFPFHRLSRPPGPSWSPRLPSSFVNSARPDNGRCTRHGASATARRMVGPGGSNRSSQRSRRRVSRRICSNSGSRHGTWRQSSAPPRPSHCCARSWSENRPMPERAFSSVIRGCASATRPASACSGASSSRPMKVGCTRPAPPWSSTTRPRDRPGSSARFAPAWINTRPTPGKPGVSGPREGEGEGQARIRRLGMPILRLAIQARSRTAIDCQNA